MAKMKKNLEYYADPAASLIFSLIFLLVVNIFYDNIFFLTEDFEKLLPYYNVSLGLGIIFALSRFFIHLKAYKLSTEFVSNIFFVVIAYQLWTVFPFDPASFGDAKLAERIIKIFIVVPPVLAVFGNTVSWIKYLFDSRL